MTEPSQNIHIYSSCQSSPHTCSRLTTSFLTLSNWDTPVILLRHFISHTFSFCLSRLLPYHMTQSHTLQSAQPLSHTNFFSFPALYSSLPSTHSIRVPHPLSLFPFQPQRHYLSPHQMPLLLFLSFSSHTRSIHPTSHLLLSIVLQPRTFKDPATRVWGEVSPQLPLFLAVSEEFHTGGGGGFSVPLPHPF